MHRRENMIKENKVKTYLMIVIGNLIVAASVSFFILPNNILSGGVAGITVALQPIIPVNSVLMINILTIGLFIIGAIFLGKKFAVRTFLSTIIFDVGVSAFSYYVSKLPADTFIVEPYLASIYSGLITGFGLGICFKANASTGGMDIPALILHKYTTLSSGEAVAVVDFLTICLGLATYGLEPALIGILSVITSGFAINRSVLLGSYKAVNVMIISDQYERIQNYIAQDMNGTSTILEAKGGYTHEKKPVIMTVITQKSYPKLENRVKEMDPYAFVIVSDVNQVFGEGYTYKEEDLWDK